MSGICLFLRRWVAYLDSGKTTTEAMGEEEAEQCNCSGRRSARSTYSRERIFCMSFGGRGGVPGNWARGAVLTDDDVASGTIAVGGEVIWVLPDDTRIVGVVR